MNRLHQELCELNAVWDCGKFSIFDEQTDQANGIVVVQYDYIDFDLNTDDDKIDFGDWLWDTAMDRVKFVMEHLGYTYIEAESFDTSSGGLYSGTLYFKK